MQPELPDLVDKRFVIAGLQGSGKSVLVKLILRKYGKSFVYDTLQEHAGFNRYLPSLISYTPDALRELDHLVQRVVIDSLQIRLFILEEANRYCPNKMPLPDTISKLNDFQRHYKIAFGSVTRRPAQLHTDIVELAHYLFIFQLEGKNDLQFLEDRAEGLADKVLALKDYEFIIKQVGKEAIVHKAIPENIVKILEKGVKTDVV